MYRWVPACALLLVLVGTALAGSSGLNLQASPFASPLLGSTSAPFYILSATDSSASSKRYICTNGDVQFATSATPTALVQGFNFATSVSTIGQTATTADWCQYYYSPTVGGVLVHNPTELTKLKARVFRSAVESPQSKTALEGAVFSFVTSTLVSASGFTSSRLYVALYSDVTLSDRRIVSFNLSVPLTLSLTNVFSFPTTMCGVNNCLRVTGVPGLAIPSYINSEFSGGVMVFGTVSGRVIIITLDSNTVVTSSAAAGAVTAIAAAPDASGNYKLFLCSESGILTTWDFSRKSIESIYVMDFVGRAWASDNTVSPPVLYIGGGGNGEGRLSRFNPRDSSTNLNQFDTTVAANTRDFKSLVIRSSDQKLVAIADTNPTTAKADVWLADKVSCSQYSCSSCGDSMNDADYCGWCTGSSSCTFTAQCSSANQWSRPPLCPVVTGMNVTEGAVDGGTPVRFVGDNFFVDPSKYKCVFIGVEVSAVQVTSTSVVCISPAGTGIGTAAVKFNGALVPNTTALTWEFFSCSNRGCDTCALRAGCAWCNRQSKCLGASSTACPAGAYGASCPFISAANVTRAAYNISTSVTFTVNGLKADLDSGGAPTFTCGWPSSNTSAVLVKNGTLNTNMLSCMTSVETGYRYDVTPVIYFSGTIFSAGSTSVRMNFYDCSESQYQACFTCIYQNPECRYCKTTSSCVFSSAPCTESGSDASACPRIAQVTPYALHETADANTSVTTVVTSVISGPAECRWTDPSAIVTSLAASSKTLVGGVNTTVVCPVPPTLSVGVWSLTIFESGTVLTNPAQISVYSCEGVDCSSCVSSDRPKCGWCLDSVSCTVSGTCSFSRFVNSSNAMTCPQFSFSPLRDTTAGSNPITISFPPGQAPSSVTNAKCWFVDINQNTTLSLVSGSYQCLSPASSIATTALRVTIGNTVYALSSGLFEIFDCTFAAPSSRRNCSSCLTYPGCNWCRAQCTPTQQVCDAGALSTCPVLTTIDQPFAETRASTTLTIHSNVNTIPPDSYECLFGTGDSVQRVSASATSSEFLCATPEGITGYQPVSIATTGTAEVGGGMWATNSLTLKFVECPIGLSSCSDICWFANQECGWCADSATCTGPTECTKLSKTLNGPAASPVFLPSSNKCPSLALVQPDHVQVQQPNKTVVETLSLDVSGLPLSSLNTTKKRVIESANFTCYFRGIAVEHHEPILEVQEASNSTRFSCHAPTLPYATAYSAQIAYNRNPLNPNIYLFQARDCLAVKRCGLCIISPDCGWCRGSTQCMTKAWCSAEPFPYFDSECPSIRGPSPSTGWGSQEITITGGKFVNSSNFVVAVGDDLYNATYIDDNTLTFMTTPQSPGVKNVALFLNGVLYHEPTGNLTFTFTEPSSVVDQTPAIAASLAVAAAAVIGIIITLVIMKRRKVGFFGEFKLKEPNYNDVAFGVFQAPMYRFPKDNYDILAMKLLAKDHGFVFSLLATTAATEQDAVAKSLIYLYEHRKRAVEYMVVFISDEVKRNQTENTIFRNNSMASKMFKYYSKIVGVKYLFSTLARFIVELNKLSEYKSTSSAAGGETSKSLLSMEMEVDPNKYGEDAMVDSDANVLQLQFACQKVFTAIRATLKEVPPEFTQVFQSMREAIMNKFQSEDAILKAVGGFLFLRFIAPALTAPHAYGLLEKPPNPICQRQLVLIGKIIQNLANMTMPGAKETFMLQLGDFFTRNIPKMKQYYSDLLNLNAAGLPPTEICTITDTICHNALASLWGQVHMSVAKLRAHFDKEAAEDESRKRELNNDLSELLEAYPKAPRKAKEGDKKHDKDKD